MEEEEVMEYKISEEIQNKGNHKRKSTAMWTLFRYADCWDVLMILVGFVLALGAGLAQPLHIVLLGRFIDEFLYYNLATEENNPFHNVSFTSMANQYATTVNRSCSVSLILQRPFYNGTGDVKLFCDSMNRALFSKVLEFACNPRSQLLSSARWFSIYYSWIGVSVFLMIFLANVLFNISAYRQTRRIRYAIYYSVLHQEIGWFDLNDGNKINTQLADDVEKIQTGIGDQLVLFISFISTFLVNSIVAFYYSWKMTLVMYVVLPILVFISAVLAKIVAIFTIREQRIYAIAGALAVEVFSSIRTVATFGGEDHEAERYKKLINMAKKEGYKRSFLSSLAMGVLQFVIFLTFALGFWYGSTLVIGCELSGGDVIIVFIAILVASFSLGNAVPELEIFGVAMGAATVIFEIADRKSLINSSSEEGYVPDNLQGHIKFRDIIFHYPARPDVQVIKGLNLEIKPGQTVALVGPSGCGKSTIIQLLLRFYDQDAGQITIDDHEVSSLNLKWLRRHIGLVSQEPVLFNTTIAENILYGKEEATMKEIQEAARMANAHDFICKLPNGYDTHVGESGVQLSGGQKQRIAIARALVKDPKILLLDEPTSALDSENEKMVQAALDMTRKGRTTIVIAHHLSTIQTADMIVSIEDGEVVEQGTHLELMANKGLYYELVTAQTIVQKVSNKAAVKDRQWDKFISSIGSLQSFNKKTFVRIPEYLLNTQCQVIDKVASLSLSYKKEKAAVEKNRSNNVSQDNCELCVVSFKELLYLNKPDKHIVLVGVIASAIIGSSIPINVPLFSEILKVFSLNDADKIARLSSYICLGYVGLAFIVGISYFVGLFSLGIAGERLTMRLRYDSFKAILRQHMGWFDLKTNSTGILTTRLATDAVDVKGSTGIKLGILLQTLFGFITAVIIALTASWELTLMFLMVFPFLGGFTFLQMHILAGRVRKNKAKLEASGCIVTESVMNIHTVVGLGIEDRIYNNYTSLLLGPFKDNIKSLFLESFVVGLVQSMIFFIYSVGFIFGAFLVVEERATFFQIFRVYAAVVFTAFSLGHASSYSSISANSKKAAARILALLKMKSPIDVSKTEGLKLESVRGQVTISSVHFNYPTRPEVKVLQGLSVSVQPGQTLALVGVSGCGKSTVVSLVERFYDPVIGSLALEGINLKDLNLKWLRTQIGVVSQEPVLFDASIAENIRYGALFRVVSDVEVIQAAKSANIHSFIESLPEGYNTNVGSKGTQLSGGQKQCIAIARVLVRDPKILLLDEATAALDTGSEKVVQEALDKAREGRTTIIIAHHLFTIHNSDVIAVIHNGKVVESGSHAVLMARHGVYYHLNTCQLQDTSS